MTRLLVIMGSGETAPTMVKPHRAIFDRAGTGPAVLLDTPYGFQTNATDISARAVGYFRASVGRRVEIAAWRTAPPPGLDRERVLAALRGASWVFAGPGSPTYALRHWHDTPIPALLADKLGRDGVVVFASAAALTLGSHTVPVYEIYKAGADPHWVPGLDLVASATGLPAVVIPHFDNAEGGHHDTRFCYLGETRLAAMERELPEDAFVLGVDEHTAVLLDLHARIASVVGNGVLTIRRRGRAATFPAGSTVDFKVLTTAAGPGAPPAAIATPASSPGVAAPTSSSRVGAPTSSPADGRVGSASTGPDGGPHPPAATSLRAAADRLAGEFSTALARWDVAGCVTAILGLEQTLVDWAADTLTSDEGEHARAILRSMVVHLGDLAAAGTRDPRDTVDPYVAALLELRRRCRDSRDYPTADWIRQQLTAAGVQVRDTPDGPVWDLSTPSG